jgi:hypothetical protein
MFSSILQRVRPRTTFQMVAAISTGAITVAATSAAVFYNLRLRHIRRIPNDTSSLMMMYPKPDKVGVSDVPYADTFELILRVPKDTRRGIPAHKWSIHDNSSDSKNSDMILESSEVATTAFARAFFTSVTITSLSLSV